MTPLALRPPRPSLARRALRLASRLFSRYVWPATKVASVIGLAMFTLAYGSVFAIVAGVLLTGVVDFLLPFAGIEPFLTAGAGLGLAGWVPGTVLGLALYSWHMARGGAFIGSLQDIDDTWADMVENA